MSQIHRHYIFYKGAVRQMSPKYSYSVLIAPVLAESEYNFLLAQKKLIQRVYKQDK